MYIATTIASLKKIKIENNADIKTENKGKPRY